jgi:hypothetical protein
MSARNGINQVAFLLFGRESYEFGIWRETTINNNNDDIITISL